MKNKKYGLPYRTYIWEGAAGEDLNGDGEIKNVPADPNTVPPTQELKEEGWCFAYGEEEWVSPMNIKDPGVPIRKATFEDYKKKAKRNNDLKVSCS